MDDAVQSVNLLTEEVKTLTELVETEAKKLLVAREDDQGAEPAEALDANDIATRGPRVARALMKIVCPLWRHIASQDL